MQGYGNASGAPATQASQAFNNLCRAITSTGFNGGEGCGTNNTQGAQPFSQPPVGGGNASCGAGGSDGNSNASGSDTASNSGNSLLGTQQPQQIMAALEQLLQALTQLNPSNSNNNQNNNPNNSQYLV
jgi:hypothetical protein